MKYTTAEKNNACVNPLKSMNASASSGEVDICHNHFHGHPFFKTIPIRPGIKMVLVNQKQQQQLEMAYQVEQAPISFSYAISQKIRTTMTCGNRGKTVIERSPGDSLLAYLPQTRGTNLILSKEKIVGVSLHFSAHLFYDLFTHLPQCLKQLCSVSDNPNGKRFYQQSRFSKETLFVLKQILACPYKGDIQRIYLESKALELVALKLAELEQGLGLPNPNPKELDRAREAYHILLANLDQPPSLLELSRRVGINRNKLNQGFKALYGDTVFNVLRNARLSKAWSLLKQTNLSLSEIALSVGYNNQSNFTTAFRIAFGNTPNRVRQDMSEGPIPPNRMN